MKLVKGSPPRIKYPSLNHINMEDPKMSLMIIYTHNLVIFGIKIIYIRKAMFGYVIMTISLGIQEHSETTRNVSKRFEMYAFLFHDRPRSFERHYSCVPMCSIMHIFLKNPIYICSTLKDVKRCLTTL